MRANIARQNNFLLLTNEEWLWIRDKILKEFPDLTLSQMELIIENGITGKYDERQPSINSFTIFKWIKRFRGDEYINNSLKQISNGKK